MPLLSITDKDSVKNWAVTSGGLKKAYDKTAKGYVYVLDTQTRLQLPRDTRRTELYLLQQNLLLQVKILDKKSFNLEIVFTDEAKQKRRVNFYGASHYAYSKDNIARAPLAARIPSSMILEGVWLNLQFDIASFVAKCFTDQFKYRSIDAITVGGSCLLRRVMTCKQSVPDSFQFVIEREFGEEHARGYEEYVQQAMLEATRGQTVEPLDPKMDFGVNVDHMNQVISFERLTYFGYVFEETGMLAQVSGSPQKSAQKRPEVCFGKRVEPASPAKIIRQAREEAQNITSNPYGLPVQQEPET